jgi:hypothetical protein
MNIETRIAALEAELSITALRVEEHAIRIAEIIEELKKLKKKPPVAVEHRKWISVWDMFTKRRTSNAQSKGE